MTPLFIELSDGSLINANHVMHVRKITDASCILETLVVADTTNVSGSWNAGGSGTMSGYTNSGRVFYTSNYSVQEWAARVNNAIALAQAVERMAK
jgi:hypothetical protein